MKFILAMAALTVATPASHAATPLELGQELASQGMLASLLPMMAKKETEEMVASLPDLTDAEKAELRATAAETSAAGAARLMAVQARIYSEKLTLEQLQALVAFNRSDAAKSYRAAQPDVIAGTMMVMDGVDFKGETMAAFCKKTGKGCAPAE